MNYSFTEETISQYIDRYLENSKRITYRELGDKDKLEKVLYKDLPNTEVKGFPVASDYVDEATGKAYSAKEFDALGEKERAKLSLRFYFLPKYHELYVGTTGSGKTTGCMEPQLRAVSSQKNKPNLFITDPKGELFEHNARHLQKQGYKTFVLNFKDITKSDRWNPLLEMYEKKMQLVTMGEDVIMRTGTVSDELMKYGTDEDFDGEAYLEYDGKAFPNYDTYQEYVAIQKDMLDAEVSSLVNQFVNQVIIVQSQTDKSWELGAQGLLKGILLCMLEEAVNKEKTGFTKEMMTFKTVTDYYNKLRGDCVDSDDRADIEDVELLQNMPSEATGYMRTALANAPNTSRSYCGVYEGATNSIMQGHIFALTSDTTVEIDDDTQPFAIFIATRDYDKSDYYIAGLFVDWVYRKMLMKAENSVKTVDNKPTTRTMHFLLDEFCNIPPITDFENKIATSRSRDIWFHLFIQSYEQLDLVYKPDRASVIKDNCNAQIFLGSQSRATKEMFSKECGKTWVPSISSQFDPTDKSLSEVAVIPVSDLDLIEEGEVYIKRLYMPVILSQFIRSYKCAEQGSFEDFRDPRAYHDFAPLNKASFKDDKHTYAKTKKPSVRRRSRW